MTQKSHGGGAAVPGGDAILPAKGDDKQNLPGYIGETAQHTNSVMLAMTQKSHGQPNSKPPSLQQVLAEAGTVAGATAQVSQAVFLEVSKALSSAAHKWSQDDHNVPFPLSNNMVQSAVGNFMGNNMSNMGGGPMQQGGLR